MSTTFDRIVSHYARAGQLLAQDSMTPEELAELAEIQGELDRLWDRERRARLLATAGPPQILGGGTEKEQMGARMRLAAIGGV